MKTDHVCADCCREWSTEDSEVCEACPYCGSGDFTDEESDEDDL